MASVERRVWDMLRCHVRGIKYCTQCALVVQLCSTVLARGLDVLEMTAPACMRVYDGSSCYWHCTAVSSPYALQAAVAGWPYVTITC
jgi:hypothetical protein